MVIWEECWKLVPCRCAVCCFRTCLDLKKEEPQRHTPRHAECESHKKALDPLHDMGEMNEPARVGLTRNL